jgi:hypothetical protein
MNFYGGGYSDIKDTRGNWINSFNILNNSNKWIIGYKETGYNGVAGTHELKSKWNKLIGNGAYICKPQTELTKEWYNNMIKLLDCKLEKLKEYPSSTPQDCAEKSNGKYPIYWSEMLGSIFHPLCYKYKDYVLNTLPKLVFRNYR